MTVTEMEAFTSTVSVVIVDDHTMFADSLARVLETEDGIELVGIAATAAAGIDMARSFRPDVVIVDYMLTDADGADAIRDVIEASPDTRVLVLTGFGDRNVLMSSVRAGCSGFLTKGHAATELVESVRKLGDGDIHIPIELYDSLPEILSMPPKRASGIEGGDALTPREREVLSCLGRGMTTTAIADQLGVAINTVRTHVQKVIAKLGAHSKLEAVTIAIRDGLVDAPR